MLLLRSRSTRHAATAVAVGAGYALAGHVTQTWFQTPGLGPTFYPGAGLTLAALTLLGRGAWPWVLAVVGAAEWITDVSHGLPPAASLGYAAANTIEPLLGAAGLRWLFGRVDLTRRRDLLGFGLCAVGFAPLIGGLVGAATFRASGGALGWPQFVVQWWIGDGLGVLVVGGAALGWSSALPVSRARLRSPAGILLVVGAVGAAAAVFRGPGSVPAVFVCLVLLVWIALRLGTAGVGIAGAGISCLIAVAVAAGGVPFAGDAGPSAATWIYLKLGLGSVIFVMLLLAVEIREREAALSAAETAELRAVQATERLELLGREQDARRRAEQAQQRLTVLARASAVLAAADEEDDLLGGLTDVLVRHVCDRASVLLPGEHGVLSRAYVLTATARDAPGAARRVQPTPSELDLADPRRAAWSTLTTTLEEDPVQLSGYLLDDAAEPGAAEPDTAELALPVGLLCAPVVARGLPIGVLALWRFDGRPAFIAEDVELADDLGHRLGTAIDALRTLTEHRRIAERLQAALLPGELPVMPGVELAARYVAADRHADVGGDFYDAVAVGPGHLVLAIGDVAGRGVDAASVTGLARATLRAVAGELGPAEALTRLNQVLLQRADVGERFLTAAHAWLRVTADGGGEVCVALGGHPPPLLLAASGEVRALGSAGTLLGSFPEVEITCDSYPLTSGDTLVLYTDGVIEARGETGLLGEDGLAAVLAGCAGRSADEVAGHLMDAVTTFATAATDDVAVLVVRLANP